MTNKTPPVTRKKDGFNGQQAIVLPDKIVKSCGDVPLVQQLFITDIGFYPKARFHFRERAEGTSQHILIYCVDGKGWLQVDNEAVAVSRGQYIIIPANRAHSYGSDETIRGQFTGCILREIGQKFSSDC